MFFIYIIFRSFQYFFDRFILIKIWKCLLNSADGCANWSEVFSFEYAHGALLSGVGPVVLLYLLTVNAKQSDSKYAIESDS